MKDFPHERINLENVNHWKPNGNAFVVDCMAFCHDGVFHVYYLLDFGHHIHPVVGSMGGHQWSHLTSTDLVHWIQHPPALPLDFEAGECSNCTGSVFVWNEKVYAIYALRSRFFGGEKIRIAVSDDGGYTFEKRITPDLPTPPEAHGGFRDPHAFIGEDGLLHILITSGAEAGDGAIPVNIGQIAHYTTADLEHFTKLPPLMQCLRMPECCDYFKMGKYYYHTYNQHWLTHIRMSEKPFGPWTVPVQEAPASRYCAVMKTAEWIDGRRIGVGWIPSYDRGHQFGGRMTFREIVQNPDGSLGTKFLKEMMPQTVRKMFDDVSLDSSSNGFALKDLGECPGNFRLEGRIQFKPGTFEFGIIAQERKQDYRRITSFEPVSGIVSLDLFDTITRVQMNPDGVPFKLIRTNEVLDLEINGNRTLVSSTYDYPGESYTSLFVRDGAAKFCDLKLF